MRGKRKIPTDISIYDSWKSGDSDKWNQAHGGNLVLFPCSHMYLLFERGRTDEPWTRGGPQTATEVQGLNPELPRSPYAES